MDGVMELNCHFQTTIDNPHHCIPQHLYHNYSMEVSVLLSYQDYGLTGTLIRETNLKENGPDQSDNLLPVGGVR